METVIESKPIFEGRILKMHVDTVQLSNGKTSTREIVEHRGAVAMVPLLDRETVIMVRQYRLAAGTTLLEIPAGTRETGEDVVDCAYRELTEEINYSAGRMQKLFESFMAPGYSTEVIHYFVAQDLTPTQGHADDDEFLEIVTLPLEEAVAKIMSGEIRDAKSISGLLCVSRLLANGEL